MLTGEADRSDGVLPPMSGGSTSRVRRIGEASVVRSPPVPDRPSPNSSGLEGHVLELVGQGPLTWEL